MRLLVALAAFTTGWVVGSLTIITYFMYVLVKEHERALK